MLRIAGLQLDLPTQSSLSERLAQASSLIEQSLDRRVDLLILPESWGEPAQAKKGEALDGVLLETLAEWAAENDLWVLSGALPLQAKALKKRSRKPIWGSVLFSNDGEIAKVIAHDGKAAQAPRVSTPWGDLVIARTETDLTAPERIRAAYAKKLAGRGRPLATLFTGAVTQAAWKQRWDILTRARAIENETWVVALNRFSAQEGLLGQSRIIQPSGRVISERPGGPGLVWADLALTL